MSSFKSAFWGCLAAVLCWLVLNGFQPATAAALGAYQLMHHSNTGANAGVFRLDTATGGVSYCYLPTNQTDVICTRESR